MNIIDQINRIKHLRLKPEERFLIDILNKVVKVFNDDYPQSIFYRLDDCLLFEQDNKNNYFWVNNDEIWSVLINKYGLNHQKNRDLIKRLTLNILKIKVNKPTWWNGVELFNKIK